MYIPSITEILQEKARRNFYEYCKYREPEFYTEDREHLKQLCNALNDFYYGELKKENGESYYKLMINMPPQHGKSRTLVNFTQWCLGKNKKERIITASYNDGQAGEFARFTRDGIMEEKNLPDHTVFSDIFDVKIKGGNASYQKWALEGEHFNYLGVGVGGGVTGKGATIRIVDDLVKDAETAINKNALDKIWLWYSGTYSSRNAAEGGRVKEIFCATPWSDDDPQGRLKKYEPNDWYIFSMEVYDEMNDAMLCDNLLCKEEYIKMKERALRNPITAMIFWANYHNRIVDVEGRLYKSFKTYEYLPVGEDGKLLFEKVENYTDTADTGTDYLCSICYGVYQGYAYILDVLYTQDPMEITENKTATMLVKNDVSKSKIESNNGGRGFARNVERIIFEIHKTRKVVIEWFYQSANKITRIHTNSARVQSNVLFPVDWANRWPEFYQSMTTYQAKGKNTNDDAQDTITGIVESLEEQDIRIRWI